MTNNEDRWTEAGFISAAEAGTLVGLFRTRVARTPEAVAYRQYDKLKGEWQAFTWAQVGAEVARWRQGLRNENLQPGDRVAICLPNSVCWICMEQAALAEGLVVVPLYAMDTPAHQAYVVHHSGCQLLLLATAGQWRDIQAANPENAPLRRVLSLEPTDEADRAGILRPVADWLPAEGAAGPPQQVRPESLATIVYTSGTTGLPKGVMLSHRNILWNGEAVCAFNPARPDDIFLSFLPLSHMFERTVGSYIPMMAGCCVAYARSVRRLPEDLRSIRPTVLISVPRMYDKVYNKIIQRLAQKGWMAERLLQTAVTVGYHRFEAAQGREAPRRRDILLWPLLHRLVARKVLAAFGGRLRMAVSGGAPLQATVSRFFLGLGLPLVQGYGLTETAPVLSANSLADNVPASVGRPLPGVEVRLGRDNELLVKSPGVMLGYWKQPQSGGQAIDRDGWLHTGDVASMEDHHLLIRSRLKEIIVTSAGEKVAPVDVELALELSDLIDQAMVVGEGKPRVAALVVLNADAWPELARNCGQNPDDPAALRHPLVEKEVLRGVAEQLRSFPAPSQVRRVWLTLDPWTIDNGMLTPTMKIVRKKIARTYAEAIGSLYATDKN